jgi:hypothetical protein
VVIVPGERVHVPTRFAVAQAPSLQVRFEWLVHSLCAAEMPSDGMFE